MYQLFTDTQSRVSGWVDGALAEHQHTLINTNHHDTCLFKQALNSILFNSNTHVRVSITNIHSDLSELLTAFLLLLHHVSRLANRIFANLAKLAFVHI